MVGELQSILLRNQRQFSLFILLAFYQLNIKMESEGDFKKTRQQLAVQIRKQNRQQIFLKLRRIKQQDMQNQNSKQNLSYVVLDQNLRELIEQQNLNLLSCNRSGQFTTAQVEQLCRQLNNQSYQIRHHAAIGLRKLVSEQQSQACLQLIVDKGIVNKLINLIQDRKYPQLQFQACWILTLIAFSSSAYCQSIVEKKGVQALIQLLYENSGPVINNALWGLGNIGGDSTICRNKVIMCGGVECVTRIVKNFKQPQVINLGCWVLSNLCRGDPLPSYDFIKPAILVLGQKICEEVLQRNYLIAALWSLCTHSQGSKSKIRQIILVDNLIAKLVDLCTSQNNEIVIPALRILGNVSTGNTVQTQELLKNHIIDLLNRLIHNKKKSIRRQACWVISNIAAGPQIHVQKVIYYPNLIINLAQKLLYDEFDVRREICFIFGNICHLGRPQDVNQVITELNLIQMLAHQLNEQDHILLQASLKCLYQFLALGSKLSKDNPILKSIQRIPSIINRLEILQHHKSDQVYKQLSKILQRFFTLEDHTF